QNAARIRQAVKDEQNRQLQKMAADVQDQLEKEKQERIRHLENQYHNSLKSIGQGHKEALQQIDVEEERYFMQLEDNKRADARFKTAIERERREKMFQEHEQKYHIVARQAALEVEKERATQIASLPAPPPDPLLHLESNSRRPVKMTDIDNFTTTHYHLREDYTVDKADPTIQVDGKLAAEDEQIRIDEKHKELIRLKNDRQTRAVVRHNAALEKELLSHDYGRILHDLSDLQRADRDQRQKFVANIPKQVFEPPHRRLEDKEERQKDLEEAFEDMYMADTNYLGDLSLALDPHPPADSSAITESPDISTHTEGTPLREPTLNNIPSVLRDTTNLPKEGEITLQKKPGDSTETDSSSEPSPMSSAYTVSRKAAHVLEQHQPHQLSTIQSGITDEPDMTLVTLSSTHDASQLGEITHRSEDSTASDSILSFEQHERSMLSTPDQEFMDSFDAPRDTTHIMRVFLLICICITYNYVTCADPCPVPRGVRCNCESGPPGKGRIINCRDGRFRSIPAFLPSNEVFYELTFSNSFDPMAGNCVSCNRINTIPANAFSGIKFQALDISRNPMKEVSDSAFNGLESVLTNIIIEGDKVMAPPYNAFSRLQNLRSLSLRRFAQGVIRRDNTNVDPLINLETLEMKQMDVEEIKPDAFVNRLPSLKKLVLEYLPMKFFPTEGLKALRMLEHLSAIYVDLTTVPTGAFQNFTNLKELILSHNKISKLEPDCFNGIQDTLEYLGLQLNALTTARVQELAGYRWSKLEQLNLGHNSMVDIPRGLFYNMRKLAYLQLDSNRISRINQHDFQGLQNLIFLDLSYNKLEGIDQGTFMNTPILRELDLRGENTLTRARVFNLDAYSLMGLSQSLEKLVLTDSVLDEQKLWSALKRLKNVVVLELGGTGLTDIPDLQFIYNKKLKYLMLENNNLTSISQMKLAGLEDTVVNINLQRNKVQQIEKCAFGQLKALQTLYLGGNPLKCDCSALWLHEWIEEQKAKDPFIEILTNANCDDGKALTSLTKQNLCPYDVVDDTCIEYSEITTPYTDPTTTAPIITAAPPVTGKNFRFRQIIEQANSVEIYWSFESPHEVDTLVMEHQNMEKQFLVAQDLPHGALSFKATGLERNSRHLFCLKVNYRNIAKKDIRPCVMVNTLF
ncbi:hypothetical protein FSP39_016351, partial [Pinctada imbricata]